MTNLVIRDAMGDDSSVLDEIGSPLFGGNEQWRGQWLDHWPKERDLGVVAEIDEVPVGVSWCRELPSPFRLDGEAELLSQISIRVIDSYRRRGIGKKLMTRLIELAYGEGIRGIGGVVLRSNRAALLLCERLGLRQTDPPLPGSVWVWRQLRED